MNTFHKESTVRCCEVQSSNNIPIEAKFTLSTYFLSLVQMKLKINSCGFETDKKGELKIAQVLNPNENLYYAQALKIRNLMQHM